jgi:hypothetical protein
MHGSRRSTHISKLVKGVKEHDLSAGDSQEFAKTVESTRAIVGRTLFGQLTIHIKFVMDL